MLSPAGAPLTAQITLTTGTPSNIAAAVATALALRNHPVVSIKITALAANAAKVYVGGAAVTTATGDELAPGASVAFDHTDPTLFAVAGTTGDKVSVLILLAG